MEGKCYNPGIGTRKRKSIGVKEILKLLSRLEGQQFGVLVTTSVVTQQACEAIRKQNHAVVCIAGTDIIDILMSKNITRVRQLTDWLSIIPRFDMDDLASITEILFHDIGIILQVGPQFDAAGLHLSQNVDFLADHLDLTGLHRR